MALSVDSGSASFSIAVSDGQWHHIEATLPLGSFYPSQIQFKIDGAVVASGGTGTLPINSAMVSDCIIGARPSGVWSYFKGLIADVRIEEVKPAIDRLPRSWPRRLDWTVRYLPAASMTPRSTPSTPPMAISGGRPLDRTQAAKSFVASPVVAPDGTIYAVLAGDTNLYAIDPADGAVLRTTNLAHTPELVGYWKFDETGGSLPPTQPRMVYRWACERTRRNRSYSDVDTRPDQPGNRFV